MHGSSAKKGLIEMVEAAKEMRKAEEVLAADLQAN
jgi:5-methyltetrahydropteroyltriglutamate--homocysteine methyltransferase